MTGFDLAIIVAYLGVLLGLGAILSRQVDSSEDLFAAGSRAPWWLSGVSAYMTMFSSGTFVVWGGIAYRSGLVATSISMCLGLSALIVGATIARRWKETGATSAAEYLHYRFGSRVVQAYTWLGVVFRMVGVGVALYSIAVLVCALVPLSEGAAFRDASTGNLSVFWAIGFAGVVVVGYTVAGGLWSVLVTDVLQFIVLGVSVLVVIPLLLWDERVGGVTGFLDQAPHGFVSPTGGDFTWMVLTGWVVVHALKIGGEWAFVQRFLCVPTSNDAVRSALLFGVLYLVSPLIWMAPPMMYRVMSPIPEGLPAELLAYASDSSLAAADPATIEAIRSGENGGLPADEVTALRESAIKGYAEGAYIRACQAVLPAGMLGLMVAAMFSATASMADSEINVFAGALTRDIYGKVINPDASDAHLVTVGRWVTIVLGGVVVGVAWLIPMLGGAESVILSITGLFVGPMVAPTIWSLFSRKVGGRAVAATIAVSGLASYALKSGLLDVSPITTNGRLAEMIIGLGVPLVVLVLFELFSPKQSGGWESVQALRRLAEADDRASRSSAPRAIVAWSLFALAALIGAIATMQPAHRATLLVAAGVCLGLGLLTSPPRRKTSLAEK